jgi:hypothetical protein
LACVDDELPEASVALEALFQAVSLHYRWEASWQQGRTNPLEQQVA